MTLPGSDIPEAISQPGTLKRDKRSAAELRLASRPQLQYVEERPPSQYCQIAIVCPINHISRPSNIRTTSSSFLTTFYPLRLPWLQVSPDLYAISLELCRISFIYTSRRSCYCDASKRSRRRLKSPHKSVMMHKYVCTLTVVRFLIVIPCFRSCSGFLQ